jgi:hypothetical protein
MSYPEVGHINRKLFNFLTILMLLGFLTVIVSESCFARKNYDIQFAGEPTYEWKMDVKKGDKIVGRNYMIHIPLINLGTDRSEQITVNMSDEEGFDLYQYVYINPGETKDITFNWSTVLLRDQIVKIYFYIANDGTTSAFNSGSTRLKIEMDDVYVPATSTPGFELISIMLAIIVSILLFRKRNNN